tara:strand:- start:769 stop:1719 length:951 start_codon:yes stop_codon:yes gene_type:complete
LSKRFKNKSIVALAGGVGGAKMILGLASVLDPADLTCVVNVGDDEVFHGLNVSPDLDTVMYTLGGSIDTSKGWGLANESYQTLNSLNVLGEETWFNLGDKDLATHLVRTRMLREGHKLTQVTQHLCSRLGVKVRVLPVSDDKISTILHGPEGVLSMQEYFVKHRCEPAISDVEYVQDNAVITPEVVQSISAADAIIICPSNPVLSIGPMLAIKQMSELLSQNRSKTVVVSPLIGSESVSGPAGYLMNQLGMESNVLGLARFYQGLCTGVVIDESDGLHEMSLVKLGLSVMMLPIMMRTKSDKQVLAQSVLEAIFNE